MQPFAPGAGVMTVLWEKRLNQVHRLTLLIIKKVLDTNEVRFITNPEMVTERRTAVNVNVTLLT